MPPPFRLGPWRVEARRNRLRQDGSAVTLRPKTMELLVFLARQEGDVADIETIHESLWAGRVVTDSSVYNVIAQLREILGGDAIETVPRRGYRLTLPVEWQATAATRRTRFVTTAAIAATVVIALAAWLHTRDAVAPDDIASPALVLLPFTADGDDDMLAWGIHNELLTLLAGVGELRLIASHSVAELAQAEQPDEAIRTTLGDARVVRGELQRIDNRLRINAFLSDAANGKLLWAGRYERDMSPGELFSLQSDIAARIAMEMRVVLTPSEESRLAETGTRNFAAWEALVIGKRRTEERTVASLLAAADYLRKAIELDPDYAHAHAQMASTALMLLDYGDRWHDTALKEELRSSAARAVELAPRLADAHKAMALAHRLADRRREAEASLRRALDLAPGDAMLHHLYARLLAGSGRFDDALAHGRRAVMIDPLSANMHNSLGMTYAATAQYDEAVAGFHKALELDPYYLIAHSQLCSLYYKGLGRLDLAALACLDMLALDPNSVFTMVRLADIWHDLGDHAEAQRWGDKVYAAAPQRASRQWLVYDDRDKFIAGFDAWRERELPLATNAFQIADYLCDAGRHDDARELLSRLHPGWYEAETPRIHWNNDWDAMRIAFTLLHTGDIERGRAMFERVLDYVAGANRSGTQGYGFIDILALTALGRDAEGISSYADLHRDNLRHNFWRIREQLGPWRDIADKPAFARITAAIERDLAAQRRSLRAMLAERAGDDARAEAVNPGTIDVLD